MLSTQAERKWTAKSTASEPQMEQSAGGLHVADVNEQYGGGQAGFVLFSDQ